MVKLFPCFSFQEVIDERIIVGIGRRAWLKLESPRLVSKHRTRSQAKLYSRSKLDGRAVTVPLQHLTNCISSTKLPRDEGHIIRPQLPSLSYHRWTEACALYIYNANPPQTDCS